MLTLCAGPWREDCGRRQRVRCLRRSADRGDRDPARPPPTRRLLAGTIAGGAHPPLSARLFTSVLRARCSSCPLPRRGSSRVSRNLIVRCMIQRRCIMCVVTAQAVTFDKVAERADLLRQMKDAWPARCQVANERLIASLKAKLSDAENTCAADALALLRCPCCRTARVLGVSCFLPSVSERINIIKSHSGSGRILLRRVGTRSGVAEFAVRQASLPGMMVMKAFNYVSPCDLLETACARVQGHELDKRE